MGPTRSGPLAGVRIVELAAIGPVPFAGMLLADMGAEILLVQRPVDGHAGMALKAEHEALFRGRSRLTLDLKSDPDRERLLEILTHADVLLEGHRPGVMERLKLSPEECLARSPRLVYGRMTGWGQTGPLAQTAGHDPNYLALTGALHAMGYADRPPAPPLNLVGDFAGGSLYLVMGVLAALLHVRSSGQGQVVDAAIVDGAASLMTMVYSMFAAGLWTDRRGANLMDGSCPFGSVYATSDGGYVSVCALEDPFYAELLQRLGLESTDLPDRWDRSQWPRLSARFAEMFRKRTRAEWAAVFELTDACVEPVLSLVEAPAHPHNVARNTFIDGIPAPAPRFSLTSTRHAVHEPETAQALLQRWNAGV